MANKKHRSYSQMATYTSCPKKYKLSYVDQIKIMTNGTSRVLGSSLHKVQEYNYRQKIKSKKDLPLPELERFLDEYLLAEIINNKDNPDFLQVKYNRKETGEELMLKAKGLLGALYPIMQNTQPLYVELPISLNINGQEFVMYIDLINDKEEIIDLKTSASKYSEEVIEFNVQLIAYALGYRKLFGKKEKGIGLDVIVKNKTPVVQTIRAGAVSDKKINRFLNSLDQINKGIEEAIFPPVDNHMTCSWCDFKDICQDDGNLPDAKVLAKRLKSILINNKDKKILNKK